MSHDFWEALHDALYHARPCPVCGARGPYTIPIEPWWSVPDQEWCDTCFESPGDELGRRFREAHHAG